jgi:hypothetical protein
MATWSKEFKLPWREAGPPNHYDDEVDLDQYVVNKEISLLSLSSPLTDPDPDDSLVYPSWNGAINVYLLSEVALGI